MSELYGNSGDTNLMGAIKTAKFYHYGPNALIVSVCTDSIDRYHSVKDWLNETDGPVDEALAAAHTESIFLGQGLDWIMEGSREARTRWHNLKYYTWVEQQGKTYEEIQDQWYKPDYWADIQSQVGEIDALIEAFNERTGLLK